MKTIKTALVSVSNKENLESLAQYFIENKVDVLSTGGTYKELEKLGVPVRKVSSQTDFPEVMDGRVKTLHPKIHMPLLARSNHEEDLSLLKSYGVAPFDLVVVNLYPFKEKKALGLNEEELTEFIDVGGPSMIRAAAKNFSRIVTLTSPEDYQLLDSNKTLSLDQRRRLAGKAFKHLSQYDEQIYSWLLGSSEAKELRYGENPHQKASWSFDKSELGLHQAQILQGKELSFNNLVDLTAAFETLNQFQDPSFASVAVGVKHNNPCGIGLGENSSSAVSRCLRADPMSVFGGIVAVNTEVDEAAAEHLASLFLECVLAPRFSLKARERLSLKKNLRLLEWPDLFQFQLKEDFKRVSGGIVRQEPDVLVEKFQDWNLVSGTNADACVQSSLEFSWKAVSRLKSNAIAITNHEMTLGLGMGQVNRVDAVKSAVARWKDFHEDKTGNVVLASDAFFPFADSMELIAKSGIKWVVQPGGSIKDNEVIEAAKSLGVNMYFTQKRHFLH